MSPTHSDLIDAYLELCLRYQTEPSADVLVWLRLRTPTLMPQTTGDEQFTDRDLLPLLDLMSAFPSDTLEQLEELDLSKCNVTYSGAVVISQLLQEEGCRLRVLNLDRCNISEQGAGAIAGAMRHCDTLEKVSLKGCSIGEAGGYHMAFYLASVSDSPAAKSMQLNLCNNAIGFHACMELEKLANDVREAGKELDIELEGNKGVDEVLNAVSHGVGVVLSIIGTVLLAMRVSDYPDWRASAAVAAYSCSLITLYLSSTLYHSFHTFGYTRLVFCTLDHCAIDFLIAGSFTPFLAILFPGSVFYRNLLLVLWAIAIFGFFFSAAYDGPSKKTVELSLYLGMGWSAMLAIRDMGREMGPEGAGLVVLGGIAYTVGVPFFLKDTRTMGVPDHTLWHIAVIAGSLLHFICIYNYVVLPRAAEPTA